MKPISKWHATLMRHGIQFTIEFECSYEEVIAAIDEGQHWHDDPLTKTTVISIVPIPD